MQLKQFQKTGKGSKSRDSTASPKAKVQKSDPTDNYSAENLLELNKQHSEIVQSESNQTDWIDNSLESKETGSVINSELTENIEHSANRVADRGDNRHISGSTSPHRTEKVV